MTPGQIYLCLVTLPFPVFFDIDFDHSSQFHPSVKSRPCCSLGSAQSQSKSTKLPSLRLPGGRTLVRCRTAVAVSHRPVRARGFTAALKLKLCLQKLGELCEVVKGRHIGYRTINQEAHFETKMTASEI